MLSHRLPAHADVNAITRVAAGIRAAGTPVLDLTSSNPTTVDLVYPTGLLSGFADDAALRYDPQPLGLATAREAVAHDYSRRGVAVDPAHLVLSSSTSEAYSWVFKLLCNPGDAVLVPRPSYPLFEHLTRLDAVEAAPYRIEYHGRWEIDMDSVRAAPPNTRALLLVSPNNPTGSYVPPREVELLTTLCRERGWAIVADEVFADYPLDAAAPHTEVVVDADVLSFTLGGASKSLGLPQVKLAWTLVGGPPAARHEALAGLEVIADAFLSVGTPVQVAAPGLFHQAAPIRRAIHERVARNLSRARELSSAYRACDLLPVEGGWSAVIRVPATDGEEALALALLEREHVLIHPGFFFDFPHEAFVVVSLLPREDVFAEGFERMLRFATS